MTHQSEAALENNLISRLGENGYSRVFLKDLNDLENNFRKQLEKHNKIKLTDDEFKKKVPGMLFLRSPHRGHESTGY